MENGNLDKNIPVEEKKILPKVRSTADVQRLKLNKLLRKHAENKEVFIPEKPKERKLREPLEFIRNIWGSSAGVGSGDFDVYRGMRRRENARQKFILEKSAKEDLDEAYKQKIVQNALDAESRTAKKRDKRQRKRDRRKNKRLKTPSHNAGNEGNKVDSEEDGVSDEADAADDDGIPRDECHSNCETNKTLECYVDPTRDIVQQDS